MSERDDNMALQQKFGDVVNSGDLTGFDDLVSPDCIDHDLAPGQVPGPQGYKMFFGDMHAAFPDMAVDVQTMVADGDQVGFAYTLTGTNTGPFQGHEPTGKSIMVRGMQISRFADGKMVERWGATDEAGMMSQLGLS